MNQSLRKKIIQILKTLLELDDPEIIRCTLEALIDELEDLDKEKKI